MTIVQKTLFQDQVSTLIFEGVQCVKHIPDSTRETLIVFDRVNLVSLFWNPVNRLWKVSRKNADAWVSSVDLTTEELIVFLSEKSNQELLQNAFAIQQRTANHARVYRRDL